jgi:tRNA threonylcarbamoyladenosine biosynthesis protein TsaE
MKDVMKLRVLSSSAEQTEALGESLGRQLRGGEVIDLVSDLGGGKTTFVRGMVRGAGSTDHVSSPTFTMSKVYDTTASTNTSRTAQKALYIHHFDFYRLDKAVGAGVMADELAEIIDDENNVALIEWSDIVQHVLPDVRLTVTIKQTGEETREFNLQFPAEYAYMLQEAPVGGKTA